MCKAKWCEVFGAYFTFVCSCFLAGTAWGQPSCPTKCVGSPCAINSSGTVLIFLQKNGNTYTPYICNQFFCAPSGCDPTSCTIAGPLTLWQRPATTTQVNCQTGCPRTWSTVPLGYVSSCTDNPNNTPTAYQCFNGCTPVQSGG